MSSTSAAAGAGRAEASSSFMARAKNTAQTLISTPNLRPWRELLEPSTFSIPISYEEAMSRVRRNFTYFRSNYTLIILGLMFLSLLWHPISMLVFIAVSLAWIFLYFGNQNPIVILGRPVDDKVVLGGLGLATILALVCTDVGENVLVSLVSGFILIGVHAAFRGTDDLFLDEETARQGQLPVFQFR